MKGQKRGFAQGFLSAILVLCLVGTAWATVGQQMVAVDYNNIKVTLNGQTVDLVDANGAAVEPFAINGTTYLPVRAVASALGLDVGWDGATSTVQLTAKTAQAPVDTSKYSRTNPSPIGVGQSIHVTSYSGNYNASAIVLESVRGDAALKMVKDANMFNSDPDDGMEYIVAKIRVSIDSTEKDQAVSLSGYSFTAFSSDSVEYKSVFAVEPLPKFSGDVYAGGTLEGYAVYQVSKSDAAPKLVFGADYKGSGGIWFSLV